MIIFFERTHIDMQKLDRQLQIFVEESSFDFEKSNLQVWLNDKNYITLCYVKKDLKIIIKYDVIFFDFSLDISSVFTNCIFLKKTPTRLINNSCIDELDHLQIKELTKNEKSTIEIVFNNEDDFDYASTLFIWVESPFYDNFYLKHIENMRILGGK